MLVDDLHVMGVTPAELEQIREGPFTVILA